MDMIKRFFPLSFVAKALKPCIISIVIYFIVDVICGLVIGFLAKLPIIGIIFSIVGSIIGLYALIGIILSLLVFFKVIE